MSKSDNGRILLPIEAAHPTLVQRLEWLFVQSDAEIVVLQVVDHKSRGLLSSLGATSTKQVEAAAVRNVEAVTFELRALGIRARGRVVQGPAARCIVEAMKGDEVSLVVMATHGRVGWSRLARGSVTEHVMRDSTAPILVVPLVDAEADVEALPAQWTFSKPLIPTDGSEEALQVIGDLADLGRIFGSKVSLLHILGTDTDERVVGAGRAFLEVARHACRARGLSPMVGALRVGDPAEQILDYCEAHGHDVIAMTTHGATGFTRLVLGSVTESVVRDSLLPVLVVRSAGVAPTATAIKVGSEPVGDAG